METFEKDYYEDETFSDLTITSGEVAGVEFINCLFRRCVFSDIQFRDCRFRGCTFEGCDLNMVKLPGCVLVDTAFTDSKLLAVDWTVAAWDKAELLQSGAVMRFEQCVLNYGVFIGLKLRGLVLKRCIAKEMDFSEADLEGADFSGTDLEQTVFRSTNLDGTNFVGAKNYFIPAETNSMKGGRFSLPEAMSLLYGLGIELVREEDATD
ncbi:MAG: pentapeptide repeat-containing protein [Anaerolineales bacterium]